MIRRKRCRHCKTPGTRRRGLCSRCYYRKAIRRRYQPESKFAPRYGDLNGQRAKPPAPTHAVPRSADKIAVLAQRAAKKQDLWHPDDTPDWAKATERKIDAVHLEDLP